MVSYIIRRLVIGLGVLFTATVLVFLLVAESGNPLAVYLQNPLISKRTLALRAAELHLNLPLWDRYWIWISNAVHFNFGNDFYNIPVGPQLKAHLFVTLRMVVSATILSVFLAVAIGLITALRHGKATDQVGTIMNFVFLSAPVFVVGLLLKEFVAVPIDQHWNTTLVPTEGEQSPTLTGNLLHRIPDYAAHAVLPTLTLVLASYASWAIYQRSTLLDVMDSDYVRFARAKGISSKRVLLRHTLRNALIPVTTVIALDFAGILGGAVVTETVFGWNGLGRWFLTGAMNFDINTTLAYLLLTATIVIVFNLIADILYGVLDPRIRYA